MKPDPCPLCGANRHIVGKVHRCLPLQIVAAPATNADVANNPTSESSVANSMANETRAPGRNRASTTYRYRNPEKRRAYQRDLMRQRRATGRAA